MLALKLKEGKNLASLQTFNISQKFKLAKLTFSYLRTEQNIDTTEPCLDLHQYNHINTESSHWLKRCIKDWKYNPLKKNRKYK